MPRTMIGLRVNEKALGVVDELARQTGHTRSTVVRVLLGEALENRTTRESATDRLMAMQERA